MNRRQRGAREAGRSSVQLHTLIFFAGDGGDGDGTSSSGGGPKEEYAYVLDLDTPPDTNPVMTVIVPRYGIEGVVKLPISGDDERLSRFPAEHRITYKDDGGQNISVRVFDRVKVRVWVKVSQNHQRELVLDLLEPSFGKAAVSNQTVSGEKPVEEESSPAKKKRRTKRN